MDFCTDWNTDTNYGAFSWSETFRGSFERKYKVKLPGYDEGYGKISFLAGCFQIHIYHRLRIHIHNDEMLEKKKKLPANK